MTGRVIVYDKAQKVSNLDTLPRGTGARFLECIVALDGSLVAKQWRRKLPAAFEVAIDLGD